MNDACKRGILIQQIRLPKMTYIFLFVNYFEQSGSLLQGWTQRWHTDFQATSRPAKSLKHYATTNSRNQAFDIAAACTQNADTGDRQQSEKITWASQTGPVQGRPYQDGSRGHPAALEA